MSSRIVIGFAGPIGSGKDAAGQFLRKTYGFRVGKFAHWVYESLLRLDPYVSDGDGFARLSSLVNQFGWEQTKRKSREVRRLLQVIGTECGREVHGHDCWVKLSNEAIQLSETSISFTDLRFDNEADLVHSHGGYVIWVDPGDRLTDESHSRSTTHKSEHSLSKDKIDFELDNSKTPEEFQELLTCFIEDLYLAQGITSMMGHRPDKENVK